MIESNIVSCLDLGDSMQSLDVYGQKRLVSFFHFIRVLVNFKNVTVFCYIVLKFFFFLQIFMLSVILINDTSDSTIYILNYIKNIVFIHNLITTEQRYIIFIYINTILAAIEIISMIYLIICISLGKFYLKLPIHILNVINVLLMDYLIGPIVQTSLLSTYCIDGTHKYLHVECYKHWQHIVFMVISMFNLVFFVVISIGLSIYYNEIGSINETKATSRINCNYEVYSNIAKIIMFILSYFIKTYTHDDGNNSKVYIIIVHTTIFIVSLIFVFYVYKTVLFDDNRINITILFGWAFISWSTLVLGVKTLLDVADTTLFHFVGWGVIAIIVFLLREYKEEYLLTDFNIFEAKNLKEIELFKQKLLSLMSERSLKSKTLLVGIVKKFDEYAKSNPELEEKFSKLSTNEHLKKKYNFDSALSILSIIYAIYDHHLDKSLLKTDILLTMCYYLINKFKNATFAISLCSKIKVTNHVQTYFKYILMEEIKENLVNKLSKSNNKESIKHVQIGSVILYNIYMDLFKIKIYDAACNQIDYFDILRNTLTTAKTTENFLKISEDILKLRKEILKLWEKLIELNPFSDESERDYMLYLDTILQDDILARTEAKKYSTLKTNKLPERNNIYHSMFVRESSTIILIDGYSSNGKILYTTPNFPGMFSFTGKEILNMSVDDLLPNVIQAFHKELIDNAIKYSNINVTFKTQKDMLLKGKTGGIFNVKLFVKCVPNLSLGLIYMTQVTKIHDHNFLIILDKDFKINGLTDLIAQRGADYTMSNNYGLTQGLYGHHVALVLPEILLQMECKNNEFYFPKGDIDLKGSLYPVSPWKELDTKVEMVVDKIKQCGRLCIEEDSKCTVQDYDELMKEINGKYVKPFSVFFRVVTKKFMDGKYKYHRIYITNDLIALNENTQSNHSNIMTNTLLSKKHRKNNGNNAVNNNNNNESKATSKDDVKESAKQIKLRIGGNLHGSEGKELLDDDNNNNNNNKKDNDNIKKDENDIEQQQQEHSDDDNKKSNDDHPHQQHNQPGNNFSKPSSAKSSLFTKSSVDSANFNKLKNGILDKKEVAAIQIMKYLCFAFGIITIILIILNSNSIENNFNNLNNYLQQNLFFNHSKISISCIYLSTVNLKWLKHGYKPSNECLLHKDKTWRNFYSDLLDTCINDVKTQKENASSFYHDFKSILSNTRKITLNVYNITNAYDSVSIDVNNILNVLISNGLKLNANLDAYMIEQSYTVYDVNSENLLQQTLNYLDEDSIEGFSDEGKKDNITAQFTPVPIYLILDCVMFVVLIIAFGYLILRLNNLELLYLDKLIKFHSVNFDMYLKRLEDLKKKLRNDTGDDEEKINGEVDLNELNSKIGSKKDNDNGNNNEDEEDNKGGKGKRKDNKIKDNNDDIKDDDNNNNNNTRKYAKNKKKGVNRKTKIQQQKNEKRKIMSKYFIKYNILFTFKVMIVFLLAITYYIVISLVESSKRSDYLSFDSITNAIEGIYKSSFDIFLNLKIQLASYETNLVNTSQSTYNMSIPSNDNISTPKLGNLLMPLVNDLSRASTTTNELNSLYNSDTCLVLFNDEQSAEYQYCATFWSSILVKGMEQSITQMGVVVNTVIDELNALNIGMKTFSDVVSETSSFSQYELFIEYYLFKSYMKTVELFMELKVEKVRMIFNTFKIILICYVIGVVFLFFVLMYFIARSKFVFNTFFNFVGILPVKYLMENDVLYKETLKLEQLIF